MNKVFELIFAPFIKAQQKAQEEVAPIIMKRYQYAEDIVSKIPEVSGKCCYYESGPRICAGKTS